MSGGVLSEFAHDARGELGTIVGFAVVLEDELSGEQAECAAHIRAAAERLVVLVDGLGGAPIAAPEVSDADPDAGAGLTAATRLRDDGPTEAGAVDPVIVLVEDHPPNVRLIERILAHRPHVTLRAVRTGEAALELLVDDQIECGLVLLDRHLPGMDGSTVLERLGEHRPELAVVVVTADATEAATTEATAGGAAAVLTKPFDVADLLAIVDVHVPGSTVA